MFHTYTRQFKVLWNGTEDRFTLQTTTCRPIEKFPRWLIIAILIGKLSSRWLMPVSGHRLQPHVHWGDKDSLQSLGAALGIACRSSQIFLPLCASTLSPVVSMLWYFSTDEITRVWQAALILRVYKLASGTLAPSLTLNVLSSDIVVIMNSLCWQNWACVTSAVWPSNKVWSLQVCEGKKTQEFNSNNLPSQEISQD